MDWLIFKLISFSPDSCIGQLCEDLNKIGGPKNFYDRFEIQNGKWLWFVSNMITTLNNKILCGCFGLYSSFVAGILNAAKRIHIFVLCNEELNYEDYIEKCICDKECSVSYKSDSGRLFQISYQGESIFIYFETRLLPNLPSELMFAQSVLKKYSWVV